MKLVLYSGGDINLRLDQELFRLSGTRMPKITYIPYTGSESATYYKQFKRYYGRYGITEFCYIAPERKYTRADLDEAFESDIVYLSGGNTFEFLKNLKKTGLQRRLKNFVRRGGVLAGMSAGAILMTPHIGLAEVPTEDADPNHVRLANLRSMNLVRFEFCPHYQSDLKRDAELKAYAARKPYPIYGCDDGSGLVVSGGKIKFIGKVHQFNEV